jgi:hypothetical protein
MPATPRKLERLSRFLAHVRRAEPVIYVLVVAAATLLVALRFYSSIRLQTLYSEAWSRPELFFDGEYRGKGGPWSAPLDDVFIHFDFARSTARGHPFEWVGGNGYSSGGTSTLYPFVLAIGYRLGFHGLDLMEWAAIVACVSVFALLLATRHAFRELPPWTSYLAPLALLGVGVLSWSLFSGMEVALFLALWGGAFVAWDGLVREGREGIRRSVLLRAGGLGLWGAALVATRPEASVTVFVFATSVAWILRRRGTQLALGTLLLIAIPGALVVLSSALANFLLTGDPAAAGAIAKLEYYHPYLSFREKLDLWFFYLGYQALRVTQQHLESIPVVGWLAWVFAFAALAFRETRRVAVLLWASLLGWAMTVALNGQVRWQNERYVMPALAWLLMASVLGLGAVMANGLRRPAHKWRITGAALSGAALVLFVWQAVPNFRFQAWYFGRGARNIYDQHVTVGRLLRDQFRPSPRVLVGDAGAIPYLSEGPTLDLIGLGGYKGMPFARATRAHVGAAIELIEHLTPEERPTLFAIYPSWWDELPLWFGSRMLEVPARGNVICGAPSKVVYRASWAPLEGSARPFSLPRGAEITAEFDWADITSEKAGAYERIPADGGRVAVKVLPHPDEPWRDVFDAGRHTPEGGRERFELKGVTVGRPVRLIFRAAPVAALRVPVSIDGSPAGAINLPKKDGWIEVAFDLPAPKSSTLQVELGMSPDRVLYHLWAIQGF